MVSACATLWSYVLLGSVITETSEKALFEICSLMGDLSVFGGRGSVVTICSVCYICRNTNFF